MVPEELTEANLSSALDGADIVYFDVRLHDTALLVAEEVILPCTIPLSAQEPNKTKYSPPISAVLIANSL